MKILLVEDDPKLGVAQKELLEIAGFDVVRVTDGATALQEFCSARHDAFDLVILDWMLPELSGLEICRWLRSEKIGYQGGILFVTARDSLEDCLQGLDAGADDYIVKPFRQQELLARIQAVGRRNARPFVPDVYTKNKITINQSLQTIGDQRKVLRLSGREFDLLRILFVNQGQVIPRETILEKIWADNPEASDSNVDSYIYLLRQKLKQPFPTIRIQTVKGIGYVMEIGHEDS